MPASNNRIAVISAHTPDMQALLTTIGVFLLSK